MDLKEKQAQLPRKMLVVLIMFGLSVATWMLPPSAWADTVSEAFLWQNGVFTTLGSSR